MKCAACGAALSPLWGGKTCPACAQGARRKAAAEDLRQAEAYYARIETETYPGAERVRRAVRARIEALKKRMGEEGKDDGGAADQAAGRADGRRGNGTV